jgi:hypothetical protein
MERFVVLVKRIGLVLNEEKMPPPAQRFVAIGDELDSVARTVSLLAKKLEKCMV